MAWRKESAQWAEVPGSSCRSRWWHLNPHRCSLSRRLRQATGQGGAVQEADWRAIKPSPQPRRTRTPVPSPVSGRPRGLAEQGLQACRAGPVSGFHLLYSKESFMTIQPQQADGADSFWQSPSCFSQIKSQRKPPAMNTECSRPLGGGEQLLETKCAQEFENPQTLTRRPKLTGPWTTENAAWGESQCSHR